MGLCAAGAASVIKGSADGVVACGHPERGCLGDRFAGGASLCLPSPGSPVRQLGAQK